MRECAHFFLFISPSSWINKLLDIQQVNASYNLQFTSIRCVAKCTMRLGFYSGLYVRIYIRIMYSLVSICRQCMYRCSSVCFCRFCFTKKLKPKHQHQQQQKNINGVRVECYNLLWLLFARKKYFIFIESLVALGSACVSEIFSAENVRKLWRWRAAVDGGIPCGLSVVNGSLGERNLN